jgi:O-antigen ligase
VANRNQKIFVKNSSILSLLVGGSAIVTLYFNSKIQDPFNSPKLWGLILLASWCLGHIFTGKKEFNLKENKYLFSAVGAFILSLFLSYMFTDPKFTGLFGETQRRNGLLNYLALVILLLTMIIKINYDFISRFSFIVIALGLVLSIYGLLQISGIDFVKWNNPYNAVISTVGNPNFAAAIMAILTVINIGLSLEKNSNWIVRIFHVITSCVLFSAIILSDARQGLISLAIGISVYILYLSFKKGKKIGLFTSGTILSTGLISILGMLQIGPLTNILYKESVSLRGYYWRAGIRMFQDNILTGVGLDRYGAYFKQYREPTYSLKYGFDITSSNAHNVPIQLFATGGLFLGLSYLAITLIVTKVAISNIGKSEDKQQLFLVTIFAGWLTYQAQSIISIDNIGISVWGWILAGMILGLSKQIGDPKSRKQSLPKIQPIKLAQPILSGLFTVLAVILISALYKGESSMYQTRGVFNPNDENSRNLVLQNATKTVQLNLTEPAYKIASANYLAASGFSEKALEILYEQIEADPRNLDALNSIAEINERSGNIGQAIKARESIVEFDPYNTRNLLQLGREYKFTQKFNDMERIRNQIIGFDTTSNESKLSLQELVR